MYCLINFCCTFDNIQRKSVLTFTSFTTVTKTLAGIPNFKHNVSTNQVNAKAPNNVLFSLLDSISVFKNAIRPNLLLVSDVGILLLKSFLINSVSCFSWHTHNSKQNCRTVTLLHSTSSLICSPLISLVGHL